MLPLLVFSFLTFTALRLIFLQSLIQTGLESKISALCNSDAAPHPYRLAYANNSNVNTLVCGMVAFFHALFDPSYYPLLAAFFPVIGVVALIPFLEAARDRTPFALQTPTAVGVVFQLVSMGVTMPAYALLFVATCTASIRPSITPTSNPPSKINQGNAEALLFGLLLGYVFPTSFMLFLVRPKMTAIWQGFPLLIALAIFVHKLIRPPSRLVQSGHPTILVALGFTFVLSALPYAFYVWPVLTDSAALQSMFMPVVGSVLDPSTSSLTDGVLEFVKWDLILGAGSVILATFWMADSVLTLTGIVIWHGLATVALGPAAAIVGVFLWRERRLNGQRQAEMTS